MNFEILFLHVLQLHNVSQVHSHFAHSARLLIFRTFNYNDLENDKENDAFCGFVAGHTDVLLSPKYVHFV